jgi:hypothetical protein
VAVAACGTPPEQKVTDDTQGMTTVSGNPGCPAGYFELKADPPNPGVYPLSDGINSITITSADGIYFDWSATLGIDLVIVKGSEKSNIYEYPGEATSDTGLHSPEKNNNIPELSHITFCYDYEVMVSKTASPAMDRTWTWDVTKTAAKSSLKLSVGQTYTDMSYDVLVTATGYTDSNWSASGTISVYNPAPMAATIENVTDSLTTDVDCGVTFPYSLASGATLSCSYSLDLLNGDTVVNEATAETSGDVGGDSGTATIDFAAATINGIDDCVDVTDNKAGYQGQVCAGDAPKTYTYTLNIGPYAACGLYTFTNTATIETNDTQTKKSDSATVDIEVPCQVGCSLTPGYWKTHSEYGPAPYDDTWAQLSPAGADTVFFLSGQSYHQVLWTAPQGNAYYVLAHAYIAAELNQLNGADFTDAAAAFADATTAFGTWTPGDIEQLRGNDKTRKGFIKLAKVLDDYNNGLIGPGHCDE